MRPSRDVAGSTVSTLYALLINAADKTNSYVFAVGGTFAFNAHHKFINTTTGVQLLHMCIRDGQWTVQSAEKCTRVKFASFDRALAYAQDLTNHQHFTKHIHPETRSISLVPVPGVQVDFEFEDVA